MAKTSSSAARSRGPAMSAARGTVLALHAAAGLALGVDREAARLLRASEGLARAAVGLLEASRSPKPDGTQAEVEKNMVEGVGAAGVTNGGGMTKRQRKRHRQKQRDKARKANKDEPGVTDFVGGAPMDADGADPFGLDDHWADSATPLPRKRATLLADASGSPPAFAPGDIVRLSGLSARPDPVSYTHLTLPTICSV